MTYWPHSDPTPAGDDGLRECARGEHCAARTTVIENGRPVVRPARTPRPFCDPCTARIRAAILDLPVRYLEISARLADRPRPDGPRVSGGTAAAPPVPINLGHEALQREMVDVVLSWEEEVRTRARLAPADTQQSRRAVQATTLNRSCAVLAAHLPVLLALPPVPMRRSIDLSRRETLPQDAQVWEYPDAGWASYILDMDGTAAGIELLNLHHRALARLGWTPQHHDLRTPCPNPDCEMTLLRRWDGTAGLADHVECRACGTQYVGEQLLLIMKAEEELCARSAP